MLNDILFISWSVLSRRYFFFFFFFFSFKRLDNRTSLRDVARTMPTHEWSLCSALYTFMIASGQLYDFTPLVMTWVDHVRFIGWELRYWNLSLVYTISLFHTWSNIYIYKYIFHDRSQIFFAIYLIFWKEISLSSASIKII